MKRNQTQPTQKEFLEFCNSAPPHVKPLLEELLAIHKQIDNGFSEANMRPNSKKMDKILEKKNRVIDEIIVDMLQLQRAGRFNRLKVNNNQEFIWKPRIFSESNKVLPPKAGDFLICLFVPPDRQQERLGDFEEKFNLLWVPRFGFRVAKLFYIVHAVGSAVAVIRAAAIGALVDRVMRLVGW